MSWGEVAAIGCCQAGVMGPWVVAGAAPKLAGVGSQEGGEDRSVRPQGA